MAVGRLDPGWRRNPKVQRLSAAAATLDVAAWCYANEHHTDGFIPTDALPLLHPTDAVRLPAGSA